MESKQDSAGKYAWLIAYFDGPFIASIISSSVKRTLFRTCERRTRRYLHSQRNGQAEEVTLLAIRGLQILSFARVGTPIERNAFENEICTKRNAIMMSMPMLCLQLTKLDERKVKLPNTPLFMQ